MDPPPARTPDQWADDNRVFPKGSAEPGKYRSSRTPYVIPIAHGCVDVRYPRADVCMGTQMGKTSGLLNVIGQRLDDDPVPCLYIGPTKSNIDKVVEPQVLAMFREARSLLAKMGPNQRTHVKPVNGVTLRLAWAGSATEIASASAALTLFDEIDKAQAIKGEGDPVTLGEARGGAYADGRFISTSSPTDGTVETYVHESTGIEHWRPASSDEIGSAIWLRWQDGTRYEWAVPCPECSGYFVPRFRHLHWPENCTPKRALRETTLTCFRCGVSIGNEHKNAMNAAGTFLAPGQKVTGWQWTEIPTPPAHPWLNVESDNGTVEGDPPESDSVSFWVSGIMSPFRPFGDRAAQWLRVAKSGDPEKIRAVINTAFGELYSTRGAAPKWEAVIDACASPYQPGDVPRGVQRIFVTADVGANYLRYVVRGWGYALESWLIEQGYLYGNTEVLTGPESPWPRLDEIRSAIRGGLPVHSVAVDAGYRQEIVLEYCQARGHSVHATKGRDKGTSLWKDFPVEVDRAGRKLRRGMTLRMVDASTFKGYVHDRLSWPQDEPGAWHLPSDDPDGEMYAREIVAEGRVTMPTGGTRWHKTGDNHALDCEALQFMLAYSEGVRTLPPFEESTPQAPPKPKAPQPETVRRSTPGSWMSRGRS